MAKLNEDVKVVMLKGEKGEAGEAGQGIPSGGKKGQAIIKASDNDYDYKWGSLVVNDVANATNDGNGNNIVNTYETKSNVSTNYLKKTDASNTYATKTDVANLEIGGRNLFVANTLTAHGLNTDGDITNTSYRALTDYIDVSDTKNITIKAHDIGTCKGIRCGVHSYSEKEQHIYDSFWIPLKVGEKTVYQLPDNAKYVKVVFSFSSTSETVTTNETEDTTISLDYVKNNMKIKIEKTNVSSDYTVAPEDYDSIYATKTELANAANFDKIYPVGSIYMSVNGTNPSTLFGGTWELLKDRFLLGAGGTYGVGATGGEATHTLTYAEMPKHFHNFNVGINDGSGGFRGAVADYKSGTSTAYTQSEGGGSPHNNMPPYLAVYMWKRTA